MNMEIPRLWKALLRPRSTKALATKLLIVAVVAGTISAFLVTHNHDRAYIQENGWWIGAAEALASALVGLYEIFRHDHERE